MKKKTTAIRYRIHHIKVVYCDNYNEFYIKNWKPIRGFLSNNFGDFHEAEDFTQEVMLNVWRFIFLKKDTISCIGEKEQEHMTYRVKNIIWSIHSNRRTTLDRRPTYRLEADMYVGGEDEDSPLTLAMDKFESNEDAYNEARVYFFFENMRQVLERQVAELFVMYFAGLTHSTIQGILGISASAYYRKFGDNFESYEYFVEKHFEPEEIDVILTPRK